MKELKICRFKKSIDSDYSYGLFHEWGFSAIETNEGQVTNYSVAIVQDSIGDIQLVNPEFLSFNVE